MNIRGGIFGVLIAVGVSVVLFVGIQILVWPSGAPDWYLVPDMFGSMIAGGAGWFVGESRL